MLVFAVASKGKGLGFRMKKRPRNFRVKFLDSGHSESSSYKARNCSTNNFNKRCLSKQTYGGGSDRRGAARAAAACEANIDTTYYTILRSTVWIIIINTHAKPLKSEHWKGPVEPIRIEWVKYYIARQSGRGQLISKPNFELIIWTKKRTKIFFYFCPSLLQGSNHKNNGSLSC